MNPAQQYYQPLPTYQKKEKCPGGCTQTTVFFSQAKQQNFTKCLVCSNLVFPPKQGYQVLQNPNPQNFPTTPTPPANIQSAILTVNDMNAIERILQLSERTVSILEEILSLKKNKMGV